MKKLIALFAICFATAASAATIEVQYPSKPGAKVPLYGVIQL